MTEITAPRIAPRKPNNPAPHDAFAWRCEILCASKCSAYVRLVASLLELMPWFINSTSCQVVRSWSSFASSLTSFQTNKSLSLAKKYLSLNHGENFICKTLTPQKGAAARRSRPKALACLLCYEQLHFSDLKTVAQRKQSLWRFNFFTWHKARPLPETCNNTKITQAEQLFETLAGTNKPQRCPRPNINYFL